MKKLLALLLALLLPLGALAETASPEDSEELTMDEFYQLFAYEAQNSAFCLEASITADEERLAALLEPSMTGSNAATMAKAVAKLLNGFGIKIVAQENAAYFDLLLRGSSMLDFTVYEQNEERSYITSSMMPGYAVIQDSSDDAEDDAIADMLMEELSSLLPGMADAVMPLLQEIEIERTRGSFAGDAYEGGVWCTTIRLDDRQIAEILQALLTDEVRAAATGFLIASELGTAEDIQQLIELHESVAQANEHQYILRYVEDANGEPVGLSAVVMRGEEQLKTFSLGITDDSLRIVTGVGGPEQNYWYDHVILLEKPESKESTEYVQIVMEYGEGVTAGDIFTGEGFTLAEENDDFTIYGTYATTGEANNDFTLRGSCIEFVGDKDSSFAYALATLEDTLVWSDWTLDVHMDGDRLEWQYAEESGIDPSVLMDGVPASTSVQANGLIDGEDVTANFICNADGEEYMSGVFSFKPCEPLPPMGDDLMIVDTQSEDPDQQQLVIETDNLMIENLTQRMLTLLPMELLVVLMQLGL